MTIETGHIIMMAIIGAVVGGYIAVSVFLLKFPRILHKKKTLRFRPVHISHRGGAGEKCENTMEAFRHAKSLGTEMLELDCHLTKDGEVVVSHDGNLLKKTSQDVNISEVQFKDLPLYRQQMSVDFKPGFVTHLSESSDRQIPTLEQVFTEFKDVPINIDIKVYNEELFQKVHSLICQFNRKHLTVWGGRSSLTTDALRKLDPEIPVFFSFRRVFMLVVCFYTGLLPFLPIYESTLEILMPSIALKKGAFPVEFSMKVRLLLKIFDTLLMSPRLFQHLEKRGIQTYLWVLNEEEDFDRAFKLGAAGVMTDFPTKLRKFLDDHPNIEQSAKSCIPSNTEEGHLLNSHCQQTSEH